MMDEVNKLVVGFFGPPGSGKTVAATSIFSRLKRNHLDTVLVTEFAHQMVVENRSTALADQIFIWANQNHRIFAGHRHAQVVVTDSPILLGAVYNKNNPNLRQVILDEHRKYNNLNIVMSFDPTYPYSMVGRIHDAEQSLQIEQDIIGLLDSQAVPYLMYNETTEEEIVELISEALA